MKSDIPDPDAAYAAEAARNYKRQLAKSLSEPPSMTVNNLETRRGVAQVGIFTGKGSGLTICIHGASLRSVITALTEIAKRGGA